MTATDDTRIYRDISERTGGDIYIGVVGPVRTGKSTLIKRFMETLVIPNMSDKYQAERAVDEMPQSAAGRTIMTTEPKFIPEDSIEIELGEAARMRVRMIDCVGYVVPSALGYIEENAPRMVKTPWMEEEIPFNMAAEIGTRKVITDHSTIGIVVTTDGSITDIPREEYYEAQERVIEELKAINKPFIVLVNCVDPDAGEGRALAEDISRRHGVSAAAVNCRTVTEDEIRGLLTMLLYEFPVKAVEIDMPRWICGLERDHWLCRGIFGCLRGNAEKIKRIRELEDMRAGIEQCESVTGAKITGIALGEGRASMKVDIDPELFYKVLAEKTGFNIKSDAELMSRMTELAEVKRRYDRVASALDEVEAAGYGIVMPTMDELELEEPEMMKQGGRYGVRLRASAPSIHMIKADITTEVAPVVGSEKQSEELVSYLLNGFEEDPSAIWQSNIFGKSLHELVNEGLHTKLAKMPPEARGKLQETVERVINEGCNGLICIIL